jgi:predicted kinase
MGLPLTGKTSLAAELSQQTNVHYVDIDAGPAQCVAPIEENPLRNAASEIRERQRLQIAYTILHKAVEANLLAGRSLIISATYSRRSSQSFLVEAIRQGGGRLKLIRCSFDDSPEEIERRVKKRVASGAIGGCRSVAHYLADKARYEEFDEPHLKLNTSQPLEVCLAQTLAFIGQ